MISTTPTQKYLDIDLGREANFTAVKEVLFSDLTISCPHYNLGIDPRNFFTVPLLTGRPMQVGHETNARYVL